MRLRLPLALFLLMYMLQGCAYPIYEDQRLMGTMSEDKAMSASIKTALLKDHFTHAFSIAVYCFYGNVFLVGEIPQNIQPKAVEIARSFHPVSVTPHWFSPSRSDVGNLMLATDLRASLIGAKGLSSTRIDTEVNAGRVVLLGVVADNREKQIAIDTARRVKGVTSVTSYLMLPPKPARQPAKGVSD